MAYCTVEHVKSRMTVDGVAFLGSDDDMLQESIDSVSTVVDTYIQHLVRPVVAREAGCRLLQDIAVDIVVEREATRGGANCTESIAINAARARKTLREIQSGGTLPPGLVFETPRKPLKGDLPQGIRVYNG